MFSLEKLETEACRSEKYYAHICDLSTFEVVVVNDIFIGLSCS